MVRVICDECGYIGDVASVIYLDEKLMNDHSDKKHNGESFGYTAWKD